ncbi:MAG: 2TM domain-containing protein [Sediminibacterium sp.]
MQTNDEILWIIAKKRAAFRKQLISYVLVNCLLWGIWFMSGKESSQFTSFPWPAWVMLWWGIGLAFSFVNAYVFNTSGAIQNEYEKLKIKKSTI